MPAAGAPDFVVYRSGTRSASENGKNHAAFCESVQSWMRSNTLRAFALWLFSVLAFLNSIPAAEILPYGSSWRYSLGLSEASTPDAAAWRKAGFDDSKWSSGSAPIGYANPPNSAPEFTLASLVPSSQDGGYSCVFVRGSFVARAPSAGNVFTVNINIDDGCIIWINGSEVGRYNVPDGNLAYNQWAVSAIEATLNSFSVTNNAQGPVVSGTNIVAVQVFNANATSSDLFFDLSIESDLDETPPTMISTEPAAGATISELASLDVVFSENVNGVDAADLSVNGVPATAVKAISPREYAFTFPAQPNGKVSVAWAANAGITDLANNPFGGGAWSYTVQPADNRAAVIISEFLADNVHGIKDEDGDRTDWIELLNTGSTVANLEGWFLTDNPTNLTKWAFPAVTLNAGKYLLIFASGKDRTNSVAPLHTNFKIDKSGGYLALVDSGRNIVSEFAPYPRQQSDVSYGRDPANPGLTGYLGTPTPGAANAASGPGFAPEVTLSWPSGVYTNNSLSVKLGAPSGQIRYTIDGTVPTASSPAYAGGITVSASLVLKARVFQTGLLPGPIAAATYTLVDGTVAGFSSNLPLLIISTGGQGVGQDVTPRTFASVVAIDTHRGRSSVLGKPEFVGQGGIEVRGQTSAGFPKRQYNFSFEDPYRQQLGVGLFGLPQDDDWAIYAPYSDKPFLQNFMAYELYEKMGHYSVRRRFVEVFLDTSGGKVNYSADYAGIYILVEKIKIDHNRVDIDQLTPYNAAEPEISGGYMFKKDKDSPGDYNFTTVGSASAGFSAQTLKLHQPKPAEATAAQKAWLRNYLVQLETALYAPNWKTATGTNHWSYYIDADSFVDYHWIVEFAKQIDGYRLSNYFFKPRNGKVHMSPIWDWNLSFGNADYLDGANTSNWYWQECSENDHIWLRRLMCGTTGSDGTTGDPDFTQKIADRWSQLRTNVLAGSNVVARAQELAGLLSEAASRDFQRWPRLGTYIWPNPPLYATPTSYAGIIQSFTNWVKGRYNWIDSQFLPVPTFDQPGGITRPGSLLALAGSGAGAIYYTRDGSDPRLPGGAISPKALRYTTPITLQNNSRIFARRLSGSVWSGPSVRSFAVARPALAVTEVMYHPAAPPSGSPFSAGDFEFVEFQNAGSDVLSLEGITVSGGIQFTFPARALQPGEYVVVGKNAAAFASRYGTGVAWAGIYSGSLNNAGDSFSVTGALGEPIAQIRFKDGWYPITDGSGFSLVPRFPNSADLVDVTDWQPSAEEGGSPGAAELAAAGPPTSAVVVNELLANPSAGAAQEVELLNLGSIPADISGWFLTDDRQQPRKFQIPAGTVIAGGRFVVFTSEQFGGSTRQSIHFSPAGGEVYLLSADSAGQLTGFLHGFKYGAQPPDVSGGRYLDRSGHEQFILQQSPTFGSANAGSLEAPVIISEMMYHPPDVFLNGAFWNNTEDEYIELLNRSAQSVNLSDAGLSTNTWQISGGAQFTFPTGVSLPPNGLALVVNFDPAADPAQVAIFRSKYAVPTGVPLFGPYQGNLGNGGDQVILQRPSTDASSGTAIWVAEDEVDFSDHARWNAGADGSGFSLTRVDLSGLGNDPRKWTAALPSAGSSTPPAAPPVITVQPKGQFATLGGTATLKVEATGQGPLKYQWLHRSQPLAGATSSTLSLTNLQPSDSGDYAVVVAGTGSAMTSETAYVTVPVDSDGDGIPDDWEFAFGLNPYDPADATQDADGDGFSNRDEYLAGTNPRSAESVLDVGQDGTGGIRFFAAPGRSYSILYRDSLNADGWTRLLDIPGADAGGDMVIPASPGAAQRFYRLVTPSL